jgi:Mn-dependent DtxR family transcriptional regulator
MARRRVKNLRLIYLYLEVSQNIMEQFYLCNTEIFALSKSAAKIYSFLHMAKNSADNSSFYKKKNIAAMCDVSESTVVRAIRELCSKGLLEVKKRYCNRHQTSNQYILLDNHQLTMSNPVPNENETSSSPSFPSPKAREPERAAHGKVRVFKCNPASFNVKLAPNGIKVYSYLSFRAGKDGQCKPSKKEIASDCGISVPTVTRAIRQLCSSGLISVKPQTRMEVYGNNGTSVNLYVLNEDMREILTKGDSLRKHHSLHWKILLYLILVRLTPTLMSLVTPQRTISRKKVTLKQRKEDLISRLAKRISVHKHKKFAGGHTCLAKADDR